MAVIHTGPTATDHDAQPADPEGRRRRPGRRGAVLAAAGLLAALAAGGLVLATSGPTQVGEDGALGSGTFRVDTVHPLGLPVDSAHEGAAPVLAPADPAPEGFHVFVVRYTATAGAEPLRLDALDTSVSSTLGATRVRPSEANPAVIELAPGEATTGVLVFQVPDDATQLTLEVPEGDPVAISDETHAHG